MDVVHELIPAYGAHVRIKPLPHGKAVFLQGIALPFCQRVNDFSLPVLLIFDIKGHRALHAVQVVVQARFRVHEQRRGNSQKMQAFRQQRLEKILYGLNCDLSLIQI